MVHASAGDKTWSTGEEQRNRSKRDEEAKPKQKQNTVVDVFESKAVTNNTVEEPKMLGPRMKVQLEVVKQDGRSEHRHFRNQ